MLFANAAAAVPIVNNINFCTQQTATIGQFTTDNAIIIGGGISINDPVQGALTYNIPGVLSVSESATIFNAIFTIYNNRLTNYNSQLASLSG